jgi:hypothetical protein
MVANTMTRPVRSSPWTEMRQKFVSRTSCMPGGPSTTSTHGSFPYISYSDATSSARVGVT